jgi:hypothetical protein
MRRLNFLRSLVLSAVAASPFVATSAQAQWSNASVFTEDGVEIGVEPRIFALFAILNGAGYDKETVYGAPPLARPAFSEAREKLRQGLGRSTPKELVEIFQKYPATTEEYVAAILQLGPAPRFDDKAATSPLAKAIAAPLREWFNEEGGQSLMR